MSRSYKTMTSGDLIENTDSLFQGLRNNDGYSYEVAKRCETNKTYFKKYDKEIKVKVTPDFSDIFTFNIDVEDIYNQFIVKLFIPYIKIDTSVYVFDDGPYIDFYVYNGEYHGNNIMISGNMDRDRVGPVYFERSIDGPNLGMSADSTQQTIGVDVQAQYDGATIYASPTAPMYCSLQIVSLQNENYNF